MIIDHFPFLFWFQYADVSISPIFIIVIVKLFLKDTQIDLNEILQFPGY